MKKKIKVLSLVVACVLTSMVTDAFANLEENSGKTYDTLVCRETLPNGNESMWTACAVPVKNGPCDRVKEC